MLYALYLRMLSDRRLRDKRAELYLQRASYLNAIGSYWARQQAKHETKLQAATRECVRRGWLRS